MNRATLWMTDLDGNNLQKIHLDTQGSSANAVVLSSSHVYSVGRDNTGACVLWITDLDVDEFQKITVDTHGQVTTGIALH